MEVNNPEHNFFRRLLAMYGEDSARKFFRERVGKDAPKHLKIEKKVEEFTIDLNNL